MLTKPAAIAIATPAKANTDHTHIRQIMCGGQDIAGIVMSSNSRIHYELMPSRLSLKQEY